LAATESGSDEMVSVAVSSFLLTVKVAPASTESNVLVDDDTVTGVVVPISIWASAAAVLIVNVPAPVTENLLAAPVSLAEIRSAASPELIWTTDAVSPWELALMAAAASASVPVPPIVILGVSATLFSSEIWISLAPYSEDADFQSPAVVFRFSTVCAAASCFTVKLIDPAAAPGVAVTATPEAELEALVGFQAAGCNAASAAADTARKVVLTVR
jgi:hypothetical protein